MNRRIGAWIGRLVGEFQDRASQWLERECKIDDARREAVMVDSVRYWGPSRNEIVLRRYLENHSFPANVAKLVERYPVIAVYSPSPIFRHRIQDVAFFHSDLESNRDVEKLLTEVAYRSFIQRATAMGLGRGYRSSKRLWTAFQRQVLKREPRCHPGS